MIYNYSGWLCFVKDSEQGATTFPVLYGVEALLQTDTYFIAPLHTGLDEGKWAFNRHDSHFDWELCPKASTLQASKASQRLILTSGCCFVLQCSSFGVQVLMTSGDWSPCIVVSPAPTHPLLLTVLKMRSHTTTGMTCKREVWSVCFTVTVRFVSGGWILLTLD